jgi:hypothetical protein
MGAPGAGAPPPPIFLNSYIARLNFMHTGHTALAYRSIEPPFIKPSSYAPDLYCLCRLSLGEVTLDVAMGTSCGFLQQLVCVRPNPPSKMTVLGQLSHRLVCSPDFETMLQDSMSQREREPNIES